MRNMPDRPAIPVHRNVALSRFEATVEGELAVLDYVIRGDVMDITHTGVPVPLRGRGIAAALTEAAIGFAREHELSVNPTCSYAAAYLARSKGKRA